MWVKNKIYPSLGSIARTEDYKLFPLKEDEAFNTSGIQFLGELDGLKTSFNKHLVTRIIIPQAGQLHPESVQHLLGVLEKTNCQNLHIYEGDESNAKQFQQIINEISKQELPLRTLRIQLHSSTEVYDVNCTEIVKSCGNHLRKLVLDYRVLREFELEQILEYCPEITEITNIEALLRDETNSTNDRTLDVESLGKLNTFDLGLEERHLKFSGALLENAEKIRLSEMAPIITLDDMLTQKSYPQIKYLELYDMTNFAIVPEKCPELQHISVSFARFREYPKTFARTLTKIFEKCTKLRSFTLEGFKTNDTFNENNDLMLVDFSSVFREVAENGVVSGLEVLNMYHMEVASELLGSVARFAPGLATLNIMDGGDFYVDSLDSLQQFGLSYLRIYSEYFIQSDLDAILSVVDKNCVVNVQDLPGRETEEYNSLCNLMTSDEFVYGCMNLEHDKPLKPRTADIILSHFEL